jgi:glutamyl-tRNA synthetase
VSVGRFAPSPTGSLHLGNLRTALVAWLCARSTASRFVIRMEDLDPTVSRREHAEGQLRDLAAMGLDWDGEVVFQSARQHLYSDALAALSARGLVYECFCTRKEIQAASQAPNGPSAAGRYPGTCRSLSDAQRSARLREGRPPALRLRAQVSSLLVTDALLGDALFEVDDIVLRRNDGTSAYNLAVIVDDDEQGIEQVVRGDDLWASTASQVHLSSLLGLRQMTYVHIPLVMSTSGARLAKRDGAVTLADRIALDESIGDVVARMAESLGLRREETPLAILNGFSLTDLSPTPWVFQPGPSER